MNYKSKIIEWKNKHPKLALTLGMLTFPILIPIVLLIVCLSFIIGLLHDMVVDIFNLPFKHFFSNDDF